MGLVFTPRDQTMTVRLLDLVYDQIPRRLRGRLDVGVTSDPYYLRVEVTVVGKDGVQHKCPLEPTLDCGHLVDAKLPDWFLGHICLIPVDNERLAAKLWDSLEE
jgi:hypothetical protein